MQKTYISDIISEKEISNWKSGERILIDSQTGSGKSEFVKTTLYNYCKKNNKKILLMSNRNLLKNQNLYDIGNKDDYIKAHNYQEFESRIIVGNNINNLFRDYDYIVYDEAHYFFSDSQFNDNTDLLIAPIINTPKNKIFLFITATPQALQDYQPIYHHEYKLAHDYSYIKNVYFYTRSSNLSPIVESIIASIPHNEKILYFGSDAKDTYDLSTQFKDSAFICSKSNIYADKINWEEMNSIVKNSCFSSHILFSTKILDNGVNLKDNNLKHIIINMLDPISFIQCLGRKRVLSENDHISLYIRDYNTGMIPFVIKNYDNKFNIMSDASIMTLDELQKKYSNQRIQNLLETSGNVNEAKMQHLKTQKRLLSNILEKDNTYQKYVCNLLNINPDSIINANKEFEKISMRDLMIRYFGKKMFKNEQEEFKLMFFQNIFTPKKTDYSGRGMVAANGLIEENNLPFMIYSRREKKGSYRDKYYWIVEERKDNDQEKTII